MAKNRTVVITGGSGDIGSEMVRKFALNGDRVAFSYYSNKERALELQQSLREINPSVSAFYSDIRDTKNITGFYEMVKETYGQTHILINNAAISQQKLFCDISDDEWEEMLSVNLTGTFETTRAFLPDMISNQNGCVLNISSIWGACGGSCETHYSASKAGVIGLTKALAKETAASKIRVNCICAGFIDTQMNKNLTQAEKKAFIEEIPLERSGSCKDVAELAFFLSSNAASYITGQVINVDGGYII